MSNYFHLSNNVSFLKNILNRAALTLVAFVVPFGPLVAGGRAAAASDCKSVKIIGVAGSGELDGFDRNQATPSALMGGTLLEYANLLRQKAQLNVSDVDLQGVNYPALSADQYFWNNGAYVQSIRQGVDGAETAVRNFINSGCAGRTHLIVAGYSQGAWALHIALDELTAKERKAINTVLFVGDPLQLPWNDTTTYGAVRQMYTGGDSQTFVQTLALINGANIPGTSAFINFTQSAWKADIKAAGVKPSAAYVPNNMSARTVVACNSFDVMCSPDQLVDTMTTTHGFGSDWLAGHTSYVCQNEVCNGVNLAPAVTQTALNRTFPLPLSINDEYLSEAANQPFVETITPIHDEGRFAALWSLDPVPAAALPAGLTATVTAPDSLRISGTLPVGFYTIPITGHDNLLTTATAAIHLEVDNVPPLPITTANGPTLAFGWGAGGQLGNRGNFSRNVPTDIAGLGKVKQVASGMYAGYALALDGSVWVWGNNNGSTLGDAGDVRYTNVPVQVQGLPKITAIAAGGSSAYALDTHGKLWSWGSNGFGALGQGGSETGNEVNMPARVRGLSNVVKVVGGQHGAYALTADGQVWSWGSNFGGELGIGNDSITMSTKPRHVTGIGLIKTIASGGAVAIAVGVDGNVWIWGGSSDSYVYPSDQRFSFSPVQITELSNIVDVAASHTQAYDNLYAIAADGTVWGWGAIPTGVLGEGSITPQHISGLANVTHIAAGDGTLYAISSDGALWSLGVNDKGQLGDGTNTPHTTPVRVNLPGSALEVAAGAWTAYVRTE